VLQKSRNSSTPIFYGPFRRSWGSGWRVELWLEFSLEWRWRSGSTILRVGMRLHVGSDQQVSSWPARCGPEERSLSKTLVVLHLRCPGRFTSVTRAVESPLWGADLRPPSRRFAHPQLSRAELPTEDAKRAPEGHGVALGALFHRPLVSCLAAACFSPKGGASAAACSAGFSPASRAATCPSLGTPGGASLRSRCGRNLLARRARAAWSYWRRSTR
jgi:hypothetical protein